MKGMQGSLPTAPPMNTGLQNYVQVWMCKQNSNKTSVFETENVGSDYPDGIIYSCLQMKLGSSKAAAHEVAREAIPLHTGNTISTKS